LQRLGTSHTAFGSLQSIPQPDDSSSSSLPAAKLLAAPPTVGAASASDDLNRALIETQRQHVEMLTLTELHLFACADAMGLQPGTLRLALSTSEVQIEHSEVRSTAWIVGIPASCTYGRYLSATFLIWQVRSTAWMVGIPVLQKLRHSLPRAWSDWLVEPLKERPPAATGGPGSGLTLSGPDVEAARHAIGEICRVLAAADASAAAARLELLRGNRFVDAAHLRGELLRRGVAPLLAHGASAVAIAAAKAGGGGGTAAAPPAAAAGGGSSSSASSGTAPLVWPGAILAASSRAEPTNKEAVGRWGYEDTRLMAYRVGTGASVVVQVSSKRYAPALGTEPLPKLWTFMENELGITIPCMPSSSGGLDLPYAPPSTLAPRLRALLADESSRVESELVSDDLSSRWRAGTGHSLRDIYGLQKHLPSAVCPDAVVLCTSATAVRKVLADAAVEPSYQVIPVGGGTNVTSATVPSETNTVMLDMKPMNRILWVNAEDMTAEVEAGITGIELKAQMAKRGFTVGPRA